MYLLRDRPAKYLVLQLVHSGGYAYESLHAVHSPASSCLTQSHACLQSSPSMLLLLLLLLIMVCTHYRHQLLSLSFLFISHYLFITITITIIITIIIILLLYSVLFTLLNVYYCIHHLHFLQNPYLNSLFRNGLSRQLPILM